MIPGTSSGDGSWGCGRTVVLVINRQANSVKRLSKNGFNLLEAFVHKLYSNKGGRGSRNAALAWL